MAIILAVLSALSYGASDFFGGLGGRQGDPNLVAMIAQPFSLLAALLALIWFRGEVPSATVLLWGALSGLGSGTGSILLYRGLTYGRISTVAPVSAIVSAVIPVLVGTVLGQSLSTLALIGISAAIPAIGLVTWHPSPAPGSKSGLGYGVGAGMAFALLFVALDLAGTTSGAWPLVSGQVVALPIVCLFAWPSIGKTSPVRRSIPAGIAAGGLVGVANLAFLIATTGASLASVSVISSLYPAVTIVLARIVLGERWNRLNGIGLLASAVSVALIAAG